MRLGYGWAVLTLASILISSPALSQAPADAAQYRWTHFTLDIGSTAFGGVGGYDTYGRVLARHISQYIPGHPPVVVENRPGAGSLVLMNYIYNVAPADGTELALVNSGAPMDPILKGDKSTAKFAPNKFNWIGSMNQELSVFPAMQNPSVDLREILAGKRINVGAPGAGSNPYIYALLMKYILHTNLNLIVGYPGMNEVELAMESGEIAGVPGVSWASFGVDKADWLRSGRAKILLQFGEKRIPALSAVPTIEELVTDAKDKQVLGLVLSRQVMGRPLIVPPGVPSDRVTALRKAFADAMKDPALIAESKKMGLEINWVPGEEIQNLVDQVAAAPHEVVDRAEEIFKE